MEGFQMKLEQHVFDEAKQILVEGVKELPAILPNGNFWLAEAEDTTIIAADTFTVGEVQYKIGFLRV
jgi:hypothetical protein